jgi:hypothetical protein
LWGKVQTAGYGAALKVLFEFDNNSGDVPKLKRTELVALFNTLARISSSLESLDKFRTMIEAEKVKDDLADEQHIKAVLGQSSEVEPLDLDDEDEEDVDERDPLDVEFEGLEREIRERNSRGPQTIKEEFWTEADLIWRIFKYIIKSWLRLPKVA